MSDAKGNNSQNIGISDAENAEIDAQINAAENTATQIFLVWRPPMFYTNLKAVEIM